MLHLKEMKSVRIGGRDHLVTPLNQTLYPADNYLLLKPQRLFHGPLSGELECLKVSCDAAT